MITTTVKIVLLKGAKVPTQAYEGDVGYDIYAQNVTTVMHGMMAEVRTGLRLGLPKGVWCQICARGSFGKRGLIVHPGIIDPEYTGELTVWVMNVAGSRQTISVGDKIAQLVFHEAKYVDFQQTDRLTKTERGNKGQGSSGS